MKIEIAICTWNRAELLERTLQRLNELSLADAVSFGVLVVDNNSNDNTASVIEKADAASPSLSIRHLSEAKQGHTFARNAAIEAASGDLLIWIDDDVLVGDDWLAGYIDAYRQNDSISFWGGPILPVFDDNKPTWIDEHWEKVQGCFAYRDLGQDSVEFSKDQLPYGANFAVRTTVQKEFRYDTSWGRQNGFVVGEDELEVMRRMLAAGHHGQWIPGACVQHVIDASRTTENYIGKYFIGQGYAMAAHGRCWKYSIQELEKESRHELFCYRMKRYFTSSEVWLSHLIRGSLAQGQLQQKMRSDAQ